MRAYKSRLQLQGGFDEFQGIMWRRLATIASSAVVKGEKYAKKNKKKKKTQSQRWGTDTDTTLTRQNFKKIAQSFALYK